MWQLTERVQRFILNGLWHHFSTTQFRSKGSVCVCMCVRHLQSHRTLVSGVRSVICSLITLRSSHLEAEPRITSELRAKDPECQQTLLIVHEILHNANRTFGNCQNSAIIKRKSNDQRASYSRKKNKILSPKETFNVRNRISLESDSATKGEHAHATQLS